MRRKKEQKMKQEQDTYGYGGNDDYHVKEEEPNVAYKFILFLLLSVLSEHLPIFKKFIYR